MLHNKLLCKNILFLIVIVNKFSIKFNVHVRLNSIRKLDPEIFMNRNDPIFGSSFGYVLVLTFGKTSSISRFLDAKKNEQTGT